MRVGPDAIRRPDLRMELLTNEGELILFRYDLAVIRSTERFLTALAAGQATEFDDQYMRIAPHFEVGAERYKWLRESLLSAAAASPARVPSPTSSIAWSNPRMSHLHGLRRPPGDDPQTGDDFEMTPSIPARRMQLAEVASRQYGAMYRFSRSVELDNILRGLIDVRGSQINGCAFCLDMHWKDALAAGESQERLYMLSAWRESPLYSERERAALELCEAMTQIAHAGVPDAVWERATAAFGDEELSQVVFAAAVINTWNRLQITTRVEPGHYHPGMFDTPAGAANGR